MNSSYLRALVFHAMRANKEAEDRVLAIPSSYHKFLLETSTELLRSYQAGLKNQLANESGDNYVATYNGIKY